METQLFQFRLCCKDSGVIFQIRSVQKGDRVRRPESSWIQSKSLFSSDGVSLSRYPQILLHVQYVTF